MLMNPVILVISGMLPFCVANCLLPCTRKRAFDPAIYILISSLPSAAHRARSNNGVADEDGNGLHPRRMAASRALLT